MIIQTVAETVRLADAGMIPGMRARCFRCGEPLCPPLVMWAGADADEQHPAVGVIALHPVCAEAVGAALIHDGHMAQGKKEEFT